MVKRWLSTFAEQPSPAALQVVAEDLGERMRCSHDLGRQRGGVLRIGGCGSRTGADADRVQRASISSARAGRSDHMAPTAIGPALFGGAGGQLLQVLQNEGTQNS